MIVPVYNVAEYLRKCLDSICNQTYKNLEIILVNDCSTDSSHDICLEYAGNDSRIKIVNKEKNEGLGCARISGLAEATGDYIGFVDSDDWIDPCMYGDLIKIIEDNNADIIQCKYFLAYDDKIMRTKDTNRIEQYNNIEATKNFLQLESINTVFWNKIYRKKIYNGVCISSSRFSEDADSMYKLVFASQTVVFYDKSYYYYRQRPGSLLYSPPSMQKSLIWINIEKNRIDFFQSRCPELVIICNQKLFSKYASIYFSLENNSENKNLRNKISDEMPLLYNRIKTSLHCQTKLLYFILMVASQRNIISNILCFFIKFIFGKHNFRYDKLKCHWYEVI